MFKGSVYYKIILVVLIGLAASSIGMIQNAYGIFFLPISHELNVGIASIALTSTISNLTTGLSSPFTIRFMIKHNFVKIMRIGIIVSSVSTLLMGMSTQIWQFYVLAMTRGIATSAFALAPIMYLIGNWFDHKQGFVTGLVMSATGISAILLNPFLDYIIITSGWRLGFAIVGIFIFILSFSGTFWIHPHPEDCGIHAYGAKHVEGFEKPFKEVKSFKINAFFILLACYAFLLTSLIGMIQHLPNYSVSIGNSASVGALMVSGSMAGNVIFKFILGALSDKIGLIKAINMITIINLSALLFFNFMNISPSKVLLIVLAFSMGSIYSVISVGLPLLTKYFYSKEKASIVYANLTALISMGSALSIFTMGALFDRFGNYDFGLLSLLTIQLIVEMILLVLVRMHQKKPKTS